MLSLECNLLGNKWEVGTSNMLYQFDHGIVATPYMAAEASFLTVGTQTDLMVQAVCQ